jgi:high-affinity nickel-transport protein
MVYSGRLVGRLSLAERAGARAGSRLRLAARLLPVGSAAVVALVGLVLTAEAAGQLDLPAVWAASPSLQHAGSLALLATALTLGVRHGIDWDHLVAIGDITSTARRQTRAVWPVWLASLYALGHALVVTLLGLAALQFGAILPSWVDTVMERVVGVTLLALGGVVVYSLLRYWRHGEEFRLQSRWMLVLSGVRRGWRLAAPRLRAALPAGHRRGAHRHDAHGHDAHGHDVPLDQYGPATAFGTGVLHGIGAETGTQVLIIAAVGGATSQGLGTGMLLAFVAGLLVSNTTVALIASAGFLSAQRTRTLYLVAGCLAAVFSLYVGGYALLGLSDHLPAWGAGAGG